MDTVCRVVTVMRKLMDQDELEASYIGADFSAYMDDVRLLHVSPPVGLLPEVDKWGEIVGFAWRDELEERGDWLPLNKWLLPLETEAVVGTVALFAAFDEEDDEDDEDWVKEEYAALPTAPEWIKLSEAARRLSCSTKTLRRWRAAKRIAQSDMRRGPGGQWVFRVSALERLGSPR